MFRQKDLIYRVEPLENEKIENKKPKIQVYLKINNIKKEISNIKMYLDDEPVKYKIKEKKIKFTPKKKLKTGKHVVRISWVLPGGESYNHTWDFSIGEKENLNYYYGNLHSHTSYSSGQGTPIEAFNSARKMGMDFWAVTDHSRSLLKEDKWEGYKSSSDKFNKKYRKILAIYGKEISVKGIGHLNLFNCKDMDKIKINKLDKLKSICEKYKDIILCINHPGKSVYGLKNNKHLNDNICLMELGNGRFPDKYNRYEKYYYGMLDENWHLGAVNGQDNHKKDWGKWDNLTVVIAPKLKEKHIFSALKNRRTYSTESNTLKVKFKLGDNWMGSIVKGYKKGDTVEFTVKCEDEKIPIEKVQIVTNGGRVLQEKSFMGVKRLWWSPCIKVEEDNNWYVLKITGEGERMGISSPIFITAT